MCEWRTLVLVVMVVFNEKMVKNKSAVMWPGHVTNILDPPHFWSSTWIGWMVLADFWTLHVSVVSMSWLNCSSWCLDSVCVLEVNMSWLNCSSWCLDSVCVLEVNVSWLNCSSWFLDSVCVFQRSMWVGWRPSVPWEKWTFRTILSLMRFTSSWWRSTSSTFFSHLETQNWMG